MKKLLLILFIPTVSLISCSKQEKNIKQESLFADGSAIAVRLAPVHRSNFSMPIVSSGLVSTEAESKLSFKVGGMISSILVREGQTVVKGQLLASLNLTEINAQVSQAKNNVDKLKRDLERGQRLHKDSAITLEQLQNLQTTYNIAIENYTIASFNKQFATIHAPTSGKIIRKFANEGEQISAGVPVLMMNSATEKNWIVKIGLPDIDWIRIKKGDKAKITFDAYPEIKFNGEVSLINEGADPVTGLYLVEVRIESGGRKLASGLFAKVEIVSSIEESFRSIPIEAVIEGSGKNAFVFVIQSDHKSVKKIPIEVAYFTNDSAMVSKGLENINEIISSGAAFLTEFSAVQITQ